jgi:hypothetical protein
MTDEPFEAPDTTRLTDADWAEINRLRRIHALGGQAALSKAIVELTNGNPVRAVRVVGAFFPNEVREGIKDVMAERGITEEDVREWIRKGESPARDQ